MFRCLSLLHLIWQNFLSVHKGEEIFIYTHTHTEKPWGVKMWHKTTRSYRSVSSRSADQTQTWHDMTVWPQHSSCSSSELLLDFVNRWFHLDLSLKVSFDRARVGPMLCSYIYTHRSYICLKATWEREEREYDFMHWQEPGFHPNAVQILTKFSETGRRKYEWMCICNSFSCVTIGSLLMFQLGAIIPHWRRGRCNKMVVQYDGNVILSYLFILREHISLLIAPL